MMHFRFFFAIGILALVGLTSARLELQENSSPTVTIISPSMSSGFQWNSIIPYTIRVSDKEDGNSEYNEISPNEVFLFVTYFSDSSNSKKYLNDQSLPDQKPLLRMRTSTCFNCHASKSKLIGPSFEAIAGRYSDKTAFVDGLAKKIIAGSSGTWGDVKMPPHPELQIGEAEELVRWILDNNSDPDHTFYTGIEGAIRTKEKPREASGKGVYMLTASYVDHGVKGTERSSKKGLHTIMLKNYQ